jgi:hypothetical protein
MAIQLVCAAWEVYKAERDANGDKGDLDFLERCMHKLIANFTWWVNRKDFDNNNVFIRFRLYMAIQLVPSA